MRRSPADEWTAKRLGIPLDELSDEAVTAYQLEALRDTLTYAKERSRHYGEAFSGIDAGDIRDAEDLKKLGTISEADIAGHEWRFQCVPQGGVKRLVTVATTGTLGAKKRIAFSEADLAAAREFIAVGFKTLCEPGDRLLLLMSGDTPGGIGDAVRRALAPEGVETEVFGEVESVAGAYEALRRFRPNVVVGLPLQTAALAEYGRRFGSPESEAIRAVLLSADYSPRPARERVGSVWDCLVLSHYGMTELCIAGGVECEGLSGYHLRCCDLLFEILEPDENGFGEIAVTTLRREAMPLIRYRTGDIGRFTSGRCPCGSPLRRLEGVFGRKGETAELESGPVTLTELAEAALAEPGVVDFDCALASGRLRLTLKALPGTRITGETAFSLLSAHGGLLDISCEETSGFAAGPNRKKRIARA